MGLTFQLQLTLLFGAIGFSSFLLIINGFLIQQHGGQIRTLFSSTSLRVKKFPFSRPSSLDTTIYATKTNTNIRLHAVKSLDAKEEIKVPKEKKINVELDVELDVTNGQTVNKIKQDTIKTKRTKIEQGKEGGTVLTDLEQVNNILIQNELNPVQISIKRKQSSVEVSSNNRNEDEEDRKSREQQGSHSSPLMEDMNQKQKKQPRQHPSWASQPLPWKKSVAITSNSTPTPHSNDVVEKMGVEGQQSQQPKTTNDEIPLLYMPFLENQIQHLQKLEQEGGSGKVTTTTATATATTTNNRENIIESIVKEHNLPPHYINKLSDKKAARVGSKCYAVKDMFRKIRMTYVDAGETLQVLNSVWYPEYQYDLPILGIDLLYFGKSKIITVIDFQPLSQKEEYTKKYIDPLKPIKEKYPLLQGTISNRYYEDTRWFSEGMLFSRMENEEDIMKVLYPAYKEYMSMYTDMMKNAKETETVLNTIMSPEEKKIKEDWIKAKHDEYDEYNMIRDPAGKMFQTYFGKEWADDYMANFLFENCPEGVNPHA